MSAELMKSKFVRRTSYVRPWTVCGIDYLWSYCMDCFQISVVASPEPYAQTFFFFIFEKKNVFWFFRNFTPTSPSNLFWILSNVLWNYFSVVLTKVLFWIFEILSFWFLFVFVNMGSYGSQNFKTLLLPQITFESFQTFSEFSSQWSWQKYCFGFLKF